MDDVGMIAFAVVCAFALTVAARLGWGMLGVVLGAGAGAVAGAGAAAGSVLSLMPVIAGAFAGWIVAVCLVAFRTARRTPTGTSRVARARDTTLSDYLAGLHLWSALVVVVLSFASLVLVLAPGGWEAVVSDHLVLVLAAVVSTLIAAGLAALLASAVLRAPQPAASPEELAWDDVLRWQTLGDLVDLPVGIAFMTVSTALTILDGSSAGGLTMAFAMTQAVLLLLLVSSQITGRTRPAPRLRRRLWDHDLQEVAGAGR